MAARRFDAAAMFKARGPQLAAGAAALVIAVGSVLLGMQARDARAATDLELRRLESTARRLTEWRAAYVAPSDSERSALLVETPRVRALGFPAAQRFAVIEAMATLAESAGLTSVQVNAAPPDSGFVPPRTAVGDAQIAVAPYVVVVDVAGSFDSLLRFVSNVPPAVSPQNLIVSRGDAGVRYRIVLSVYEVSGGQSN